MQRMIQKAKLERFKRHSNAENKLSQEDGKQYSVLVEAISKQPKPKMPIIALLLQNTMEVLPSLQLAAERERRAYGRR